MTIVIIILSVLLTVSICVNVFLGYALDVNLDRIETYQNWITEFKKDLIEPAVVLVNKLPSAMFIAISPADKEAGLGRRPEVEFLLCKIAVMYKLYLFRLKTICTLKY